MSLINTFPSSGFVRRIGATRPFAVIDLRTDATFSPSGIGAAPDPRRYGKRTRFHRPGSSLFGWLRLWRHRSIERRALLELTADQLADIGLTADAVHSEARRWPWDGRDQPR